MDLFDLLAVVGALTGTAGATTQIYVARRDRARITVTFGYRDTLGAMIAPYLDVVNVGRQPIALLDAGLYGGEFPIKILQSDPERELHTDASWALRCLDEPQVMQQGQHLRLPLSFSGMLGAVVEDCFHMDFPFRPFVDTPEGRTWGKAGPFVRMIYPDNDRPPEIGPPYWMPCDPPLRPARVDSTWKLWKKPELRTGSRRRPSYKELQRRTGFPAEQSGG